MKFSAFLFFIALVACEPWTLKHEPGRCAMRGQCGKQSFFGKSLPCPDNDLAEEPSQRVRQKLVDVCGSQWAEGPICCNEDQIDGLASNLKVANNMIASCGACKENFYNLFCTFTCSPDQSTFVNITDMAPKDDKFLVTQLDNLWSDAYGAGFYDSCKDVKFGPTNTRAMSFIGGNAENYTEFFAFLGKKQALGSPFQINFPRGGLTGMEERNDSTHPCNSTDPNYRCACLDCDNSCSKPIPLEQSGHCHVGALPCLSFSVILIYAVCIALLVTAITGHVAYQKHTHSKQERMRLLQDTDLSDDEDDVVYHPGVLTRPTADYFPNVICNVLFTRLGRLCATFPGITISTAIFVVGLLSLGWLRFTVETDPVRLWVSPSSPAALEKAFFDDNFGPFFRAEQAFVVNASGNVLNADTLNWWSTVEDRVLQITAGHVNFDDICYKPTGQACVVQSILRYWDSIGGFEPRGWEEQLQHCLENNVDCLPDFGQPIQANMVLGGGVLDAKAIITTWVVNNQRDEHAHAVMSWEDELQVVLAVARSEAEERGLRLSYNTEISLEQELNKSSNTDAKIVIISYIVMFIYVSLALGSPGSLFSVQSLVQSKFMLGVFGIMIVLGSVSASVGLFSATGVKVTLIIAEVIPFLVLAVGVDNIFLIVHEFERVNSSHPDSPVEERMGKALGRVGPSILLSASMETVAFALGAFVGMPAVRNFAAYAAGAVFINAVLQVTMFISVLTLDQLRVERQRIDCIPCIQVRASSVSDGSAFVQEGLIQRFIRRKYAPVLLGKRIKVTVFVAFLGLLTAGLALLPGIQLGLDQRIALPSNSYLVEYFDDVADYLGVGPPVYFVTRELNVTERRHQQELCGRFSTCHQDSLSNILEMERKRSSISYIADPTASWVDDFFLWLNPDTSCCMNQGSPCLDHYNVSLDGMPEGQEYAKYLAQWLKQIPDEDCPLAGKAAYGDAVVYKSETIAASHFRTAHTPLRTQEDFISAYASARRICDEIMLRNPGVSVFPYSIFYVFFDQYASIVRLTLALLGSAVAACFIFSTVLLGSVRTGLVVSLTVVMTLVDIGGAMAVAGVSLNALTLVNLVICVGISVEFCAHIARAFQFPSSQLLDRNLNNHIALRGKDARAWAALSQVGASVFTGITITKLLGVLVLAFTRSKIFEIYYFRVWLALVIFAAIHALIFLPVALSWLGGNGSYQLLKILTTGYSDSASDGGLEEDLARRRGRPLMPDDDEYDSDMY